MEIPVDAEVHTTDGRFGRSTYIILNPATDTVTHVVVRSDERPHTEYVVPIELIAETTRHSIRIRATEKELKEMDTFSELEFIRADIKSSLKSTSAFPRVSSQFAAALAWMPATVISAMSTNFWWIR